MRCQARLIERYTAFASSFRYFVWSDRFSVAGFHYALWMSSITAEVPASLLLLFLPWTALSLFSLRRPDASRTGLPALFSDVAGLAFCLVIHFSRWSSDDLPKAALDFVLDPFGMPLWEHEAALMFHIWHVLKSRPLVYVPAEFEGIPDVRASLREMTAGLDDFHRLTPPGRDVGIQTERDPILMAHESADEVVVASNSPLCDVADTTVAL
jgi:hypothetical protein